VGPLVLAFVLGDMMEQSLRQSLIASDGSFLTFVTRPISLVSLIIAFLLLVSSFIPFLKPRKERVSAEST